MCEVRCLKTFTRPVLYHRQDKILQVNNAISIDIHECQYLMKFSLKDMFELGIGFVSNLTIFRNVSEKES